VKQTWKINMSPTLHVMFYHEGRQTTNKTYLHTSNKRHVSADMNLANQLAVELSGTYAGNVR